MIKVLYQTYHESHVLINIINNDSIRKLIYTILI